MSVLSAATAQHKQLTGKKNWRKWWKTVDLVPGRLACTCSLDPNVFINIPFKLSLLSLLMYFNDIVIYATTCSYSLICTLIIMVEGQRVAFVKHEMLPTRETQGNASDTCGFHFPCFFVRNLQKVRTKGQNTKRMTKLVVVVNDM